MKPVIESIAASTELVKWVQLISSDKDLIRMAETVINKNNAAVDWITREKERCK